RVQQLDALGIGIDVADAPAVFGAVEIPITLALHRTGGEREHVLDQRAADVHPGTKGVEVAGAGLDLSVPVGRRPLGLDLDRAAGTVATVQGALRPTQHFEAIDVEEIEERTIDARLVDV